MPRKPRSGYVPPTTKVGINLPTEVADYFRAHALREFSDEMLGAVILWMSTGPEASKDKDTTITELRERAYRYGRTLEVEAAIKRLREEFVDLVGNQLVAEHVQTLPRAERNRLLAQAKGLPETH